ncbi:MAG: hypothetical protein ACT4OE_06330 [Sphingosinicella sp.]
MPVWKDLTRQTRQEKQGTLDGMNLFFGALLGANLGAVGDLPLGRYAMLIAILAGTVMTLRVFSTSERRKYAIGLLLSYVLLMGIYLYSGYFTDHGLSQTDRDRLAVTLAVWLSAVLIVELYPVTDGGGGEIQA